MRNEFGGNLKYAWNAGEFSFDAGALLSSYNGTHDSFTALHNIRTMNFATNVKSADGSDNSVYYDIDAAFIQWFQTYGGHPERKQSLIEQWWVRPSMCIVSIFDFDISFSMYGGFRDHTAGILEISPIYEYNKGRFLANSGRNSATVSAS